jgi:hypothetical protein
MDRGCRYLLDISGGPRRRCRNLLVLVWAAVPDVDAGISMFLSGAAVLDVDAGISMFFSVVAVPNVNAGICSM